MCVKRHRDETRENVEESSDFGASEVASASLLHPASAFPEGLIECQHLQNEQQAAQWQHGELMMRVCVRVCVF